MIHWNQTTITRTRMALELHDNALRSLQEWKRRKYACVHLQNDALNNWEKQLRLRIAENMDAINEACDALSVTEILQQINAA